jgi:hypothetical protein
MTKIGKNELTCVGTKVMLFLTQNCAFEKNYESFQFRNFKTQQSYLYINKVTALLFHISLTFCIQSVFEKNYKYILLNRLDII